MRPEDLRPGYVSSDLYSHPVGWLGAGPTGAAHDHDDFEVVVYANQTCADALTERIRGSVGIVGVLDPRSRIRRRRRGANSPSPTKLIFLWTLPAIPAGTCLPVFAHRPAPIQVTWLGYFASTGLPTMDYALLDDAHLVDGADKLFSEKIVRLPGCRSCYMAPDHADEPKEAPSARGKPTTFGSFIQACSENKRGSHRPVGANLI